MAASEADTKILLEARDAFNEAMDADRENRERGMSDARFECDDGESGEQWPLAVRKARAQEGRPCLTVNRMRSFVRQVTNELRMQPSAINISAAQDGDRQTAYVIEGLIRAIEQSSKAPRVYARGGEDAARCNMGFWRVTKEYASDEDFDQDLRIRPIPNPFSVLVDPFATDSTGRDWRYCIVYDDMPRKEFEAQFKDAVEMDFYSDKRDIDREWISRDTIRVAEYWTVEEKATDLLLLSDGSTIYADEKDAVDDAKTAGLKVVKSRKTKRKSVMMRLLTGVDVLETHEWEGSRIPIVPVWGEEARVGARKVRNGVISFAKDSQRMLNYWRTASVERMALAPKAPWLVTPTQIKGFEKEWKNAGTGNPSILRYNPEGRNMPTRIAPAQVEVAMIQEAAIASDDMKATTGIYDASLGAKSNETSGKAIIARQKEGDVGTFAFIDNVHDAIEETGRILVDMIPHVYDTERQVRILGKKNETAVVTVNGDMLMPSPDGQPAGDQSGAPQMFRFDLTRGKYDVVVSTGPSVTTQRQETAAMLVEVLQSAPQLAPAILPRLAECIDLPDADEFAAEVKQLMAPQQQQIDPLDQAKVGLTEAQTLGQNIKNTEDAHKFGFSMGGGGTPPPDPQAAPAGQPG